MTVEGALLDRKGRRVEVGQRVMFNPHGMYATKRASPHYGVIRAVIGRRQNPDGADSAVDEEANVGAAGLEVVEVRCRRYSK